MADVQIVEKEKSTTKLKRELEGWREIILLTNSIFLWEKNWHAGFIVGFSSTIFFLLWFIDPSLLTAISSICLLITVVDYLVPTFSANIFNSENWTGNKEKQFEDICQTIVSYKTLTTNAWNDFRELKMVKPKAYYAIAILILSFLSWVGTVVDNLLLTYIIVTVALLLPGLSHHGILRKYYQLILRYTTNFLRGLNGGEKLKTK